MTKTELVNYILSNTSEYKKSHLNEKHKEELESIAAGLSSTAADPAVATDPVEDVPVDATVSPEAEAELVVSSENKRTKINDTEKLMLATIPTLPDFENVGSVMNGRNFLKVAEEVHAIPIRKGQALFASLKNKGYYSTMGRESGQARTTFQLSDIGIKYLSDNGLLAAV